MNSLGKLAAVTSGIVVALMFATTMPEMMGMGWSVSMSPAAPSFDSSLIARLPSISINQLPPEASQTIRSIQRGGPFPYRQDGIVFGNRERRLPVAPYRTYHEYTVPTPGSPTRGARRIITAPHDVYYYTGDHYRSFRRVVK
jgi:ribonuclease T1